MISMPISGPYPVTVFTTPEGKPTASISSMNAIVEAEVNSDGLITATFPAASAGASFHVNNNKGEFHGVIMATTPNGSYWV